MTTEVRARPAPSPLPRLPEGFPPPPDADDVVWREVVREFSRYNRQAVRSRIGYLSLRLVALVVGAVVTVLAAIDAPPAVTAGFAAVIVVAEGAQQLFQLHTHWISYRATAETLRRAAFLFAAGIEPYNDPQTCRGQLATVLRDTVAAENTDWASSMRQAPPRPETR
jgi:hypothetical protein